MPNEAKSCRHWNAAETNMATFKRKTKHRMLMSRRHWAALSPGGLIFGNDILCQSVGGAGWNGPVFLGWAIGSIPTLLRLWCNSICEWWASSLWWWNIEIGTVPVMVGLPNVTTGAHHFIADLAVGMWFGVAAKSSGVTADAKREHLQSTAAHRGFPLWWPQFTSIYL